MLPNTSFGIRATSPAQSQSSPAMAAGEAADVSGDGKGVGPQFEPETGVAAAAVPADASEASLPLRRISPAHGAQLLSAGARCISLLKVFSRKFPTAKPRQALYEGMLASLGGNWAAARKSWARSLAEADALNWPYEKGLVAELMADSESAAGFEEHAARWAADSSTPRLITPADANTDAVFLHGPGVLRDAVALDGAAVHI